MTVADIASAATTYLLYLMAAVPFAVWSGRIASWSIDARRTEQNPAQWPGRAATLFLAVLPLCLTAWFLVRGFQAPDPVDPSVRDDWGQVNFLIVPPCCGLVLGYCLAVMIARRR